MHRRQRAVQADVEATSRIEVLPAATVGLCYRSGKLNLEQAIRALLPVSSTCNDLRLGGIPTERCAVNVTPLTAVNAL